MARVCRPDGKVLLVEAGLADSLWVRLGQDYLGLVPNPKHPWEVGWFDNRDVSVLLNKCPKLKVSRKETRAMGNWYLIVASPTESGDSGSSAPAASASTASATTIPTTKGSSSSSSE